MTVKRLRQILKALADDTRLRIIAILLKKEMTVKEIYEALETNQSKISKHLVRLRLLRITSDRREKNFIYYSLNKNTEQGRIAKALVEKFKDLEIFKKDLKKLGSLKK